MTSISTVLPDGGDAPTCPSTAEQYFIQVLSRRRREEEEKKKKKKLMRTQEVLASRT
jgi:hypothetical protein